MSCYHPVPSITATMEEMPERNTWAGQIMVSLCDLRVYFLCPACMLSSSSIHSRYNGGDARMAHVGRSNYGESRYFVCFYRSQSILLMSSSSIHYRHNGGDARKAHVKHPVPSITATMEGIPERHTLSIQFHPLPPQWRRCQKGTRWPVKLW